MSWLSNATGVDVNISNARRGTPININGPGKELRGNLRNAWEGDIGKGLRMSGLAGLPLQAQETAGMLGMGKKKDAGGAGQNYGELLGKWDAIGNEITGTQQNNLMNNMTNQQAGAQAQARSALAMRGGASSGSNERLAQQGAWDQLNAASDIAQNQFNQQLAHKQAGIKEIQLPVMQGKDMMDAQRRAQQAAEGNSLGALLGGVAGGVGGAFLGGPAGAAAGYQIGTGLGKRV